MTRPTNIVVDLGALRANYRLARRVHGHHALAVIKANAYGHGALQCANALAPDGGRIRRRLSRRSRGAASRRYSQSHPLARRRFR